MKPFRLKTRNQFMYTKINELIFKPSVDISKKHVSANTVTKTVNALNRYGQIVKHDKHPTGHRLFKIGDMSRISISKRK
jgi:hypothetical protein